MKLYIIPVVSVLGLVFSALASPPAHAFSYTLTELAPGVNVLFETKPNRALSLGEEFTVTVTVNNTSTKAITDADINVSTHYAPPLELRQVSPHPHLLNDHEEEKKYFDVAWENQTIPANTVKKYLAKYRVSPTLTKPERKEGYVIMLSARSAQSDTGSVWKVADLPVSGTVASTTPRNGAIVDNIFYAAYQRFPTKAEQTKWKKKYESLDKQPGPCLGTESCSRGSFLLKLMSDEAKKKTATPGTAVASKDIPTLFNSVFGRQPTAVEKSYWTKRLADKPDRASLVGAMHYQKAQGKTIGK